MKMLSTLIFSLTLFALSGLAFSFQFSHHGKSLVSRLSMSSVEELEQQLEAAKATIAKQELELRLLGKITLVEKTIQLRA